MVNFFQKRFKIGKKNVGENSPSLVIAEISANHNGNFRLFKRLIKAAKKSGADLVKIQTYTANSLTINSNKNDFLIKKDNPWGKKKYLWNLYKKAQTSNELNTKIFQYARSIGIEIFSSPFDINAVNTLKKLNCPAYKIASAEINHIPLIEKVAETKKPIILSLGLAKIEDIKLALETIRRKKNNKVILLQCVSSYPAPISEQNLKSIKYIKKKFGTICGLSDHTKGYIAPIVAVAMGAKVIEKHFNINNNKSVDSFFSTNQNDFKKMIGNIRLSEKSFGDGKFKISKSSKLNFHSRRSIYVSKNIKKNELITKDNVKIVRPHYGLHPKFYKLILNKRSKVNLKIGDRFRLKYVKKK